MWRIGWFGRGVGMALAVVILAVVSALASVWDGVLPVMADPGHDSNAEGRVKAGCNQVSGTECGSYCIYFRCDWCQCQRAGDCGNAGPGWSGGTPCCGTCRSQCRASRPSSSQGTPSSCYVRGSCCRERCRTDSDGNESCRCVRWRWNCRPKQAPCLHWTVMQQGQEIYCMGEATERSYGWADNPELVGLLHAGQELGPVECEEASASRPGVFQDVAFATATPAPTPTPVVVELADYRLGQPLYAGDGGGLVLDRVDFDPVQGLATLDYSGDTGVLVQYRYWFYNGVYPNEVRYGYLDYPLGRGFAVTRRLPNGSAGSLDGVFSFQVRSLDGSGEVVAVSNEVRRLFNYDRLQGMTRDDVLDDIPSWAQRVFDPAVWQSGHPLAPKAVSPFLATPGPVVIPTVMPPLTPSGEPTLTPPPSPLVRPDAPVIVDVAQDSPTSFRVDLASGWRPGELYYRAWSHGSPVRPTRWEQPWMPVPAGNISGDSFVVDRVSDGRSIQDIFVDVWQRLRSPVSPVVGPARDTVDGVVVGPTVQPTCVVNARDEVLAHYYDVQVRVVNGAGIWGDESEVAVALMRGWVPANLSLPVCPP